MAILTALTMAGVGLVVLFERHVARSLAEDLEVHLNQLLAGIDVDAQGRIVVTAQPTDPRFAEPLSGLYWQIADDRDNLLRSRSLWDSALALPVDALASPQVQLHEIPGPGNSGVLAAARQISLTVNGRRVPVRVAVAANLDRVSRATAAFAKDLAVALAILGLVLAAATAIQVGLGLRPLAALRRGIADIRSGRANHLGTGVPGEVQPLVEEVNALPTARNARSSAHAGARPILRTDSRRLLRRLRATPAVCASKARTQWRETSKAWLTA